MRKFTLFLLDILVLYTSLALTLYIRYSGNFQEQWAIHFKPFSLIFALWLLIFYIANMYDISSIRNTIHFYSNLFRTVAVAFAISVVFFYLVPLFAIAPKRNLFIFMLVFFGLEFLIRRLFNNVNEKGFKQPTIIVGLSLQALELAQFIQNNPQLGYEIKYMADISSDKDIAEKEYEQFRIIKGVNDVNKIIKEEKINTVIISPEAYRVSEVIDTFYKAIEDHVTFKNLSTFYENLTGRVLLGAINQIWFLENLSEGGKKPYETAKRVLDLIFAVIMGTVSLIFYPFIILLIKTTSKGPVFYRQKRLGRLGKEFEIIKFRSMIPDAERSGAVWAKEDDPRITKVGKFLRKTRMDELPQLWNILKGEMAFVGPRAERPEFHNKLKEGVPYYEERYLIKPGLTGWAQINFHYGSSVTDAGEKLKYDLYYIKNRSLFLDLGIVLKTINIVFRQEGQ